MLSFLRRLFGLRRAGDTVPGFGLTICIQGYDGLLARSVSAAWLVARDAAGTSLLACQVEVGTDRGMMDDFPEGDYGLDAEAVPSGSELRLQARVGEYAPPPVHGRASLLIHGNRPGSLADGCIRMGDADLAQLMSLLPPDPGQVLVQLFRPAEADTGDADAGGSEDTSWRRQDERRGGEGGEAGTVPEVAPAPDGAGTNADQAAAAALAGLGYAMLSGQDPVASEASEASIAAVAVAAEAPVAADPKDDAAGWTPSGGAYGG